MTDQERKALEPIPGRECSECTACCKHLTIDTPELQKLPGVLCAHCTEGRGCGIYHSRPQVCRGFYCGWRLLDWLKDDWWRPDRCDVMVVFRFDEIPAGYTKSPAIAFDFLGKFRAVLDERFLRTVGFLVDQRVPVFILVPGKAGEASRRIFMNEGLKDAVARRDRVGVMTELVSAIEVGVHTPKETVVLGNTKQDS